MIETNRLGEIEERHIIFYDGLDKAGIWHPDISDIRFLLRAVRCTGTLGGRMIETKEHFEKIAFKTRVSGDLEETVDLLETIEALREVARAGRAIKEAEDGYPQTHTELHLIGAHDDMAEALDALPEWILE